MNLKDHVPDQEYCKRLEELGFDQESSLFSYFSNRFTDEISVRSIHSSSAIFDRLEAAPTVGELGLCLPEKVRIKERNQATYFESSKHASTVNGPWFCYYNDLQGGIIKISDPKEANARCKLLIHLLENNLVDIESVNERMRTA